MPVCSARYTSRSVAVRSRPAASVMLEGRMRITRSSMADTSFMGRQPRQAPSFTYEEYFCSSLEVRQAQLVRMP